MHPSPSGSGRLMGEAQFGVTFFTSSQRQDTCGSNGLPVTPNSIRILGRSRYLKSLSHPNLAEYVDIIRGKHERIIIISEYYETNLGSVLKTQKIDFKKDLGKLISLISQILRAFIYLNEHGMVARNLNLDSILFDSSLSVKLFNYGIHHITNGGNYVSFPIGQPKYSAPEVFLAQVKTGSDIFSCDVWALGIILVEICLGKPLWDDLKLPQIIRKVAAISKLENGVLNFILEDQGALHILENIDPTVVSIINVCLECDFMKRPWPKDLLKFIEDSKYYEPPPLIRFLCTTADIPCNCELPGSPDRYSPFSGKLFFQSSCLSMKLTKASVSPKSSEKELITFKNGISESNHLGRQTLKEVYHFWQLAGGDVIAELKRQGLTRKKPAILSLPRSMALTGESVGTNKERGLLLDNTVIILPLGELIKRLSRMPQTTYYPLIVSLIPGLQTDPANITKEAAALPLIIRERDIEYQFNRILLFNRLIKGYPYTKDLIHTECLRDIPPFFRSQVWTCLLGIEGDIESAYAAIDKETPTSTDRQIEVDIPRCHQYDELLSSPSGHEKFKRVLKAWVVSNKEYVYWQGLDSLCAPFLYLNFNNEAMAFTCLSSFIPKYLYKFFLKDNSAVIQEYLAKFSQLIAFNDPELTNHLDSIGFIPELYAIPWFLTMFSHVFPLHKIFHLWDKLLLGDSSFSLCIGLSILFQLREGLLCSGFNECILLFSDMPEINIEKCVEDSVETYCNTPKSVLCRKYEPPDLAEKASVLKNLGQVPSSQNIPFGSYNTAATCLPTNDALKMHPISLADLKKEKCPQISGEDLLQLLTLKESPSKKIGILVIDVRNREDYNRGTIPGSLNIPYGSAFTSEGCLASSEDINVLNGNRGALLVVVGNRGDSATQFAEKLLRLEYPRVCVLHKGIDILRSGHILILPSTV